MRPRAPQSFGSAVACAAIPVIVATVLGLWRIDQKGLWPDEAFSARVSFVRPSLFPRYLIIAVPPLVTIAGLGVTALPLWLRAVALTLFLVLTSSPLASYYRTPIREGGDWRGAAEFVIREQRPGDRILFLSSYGRGPFEYYLKQGNGPAGLVPLYPSLPWGSPPLIADRQIEPPAVAARDLRSATRVWAFLAWGGFDSKAEDAAPLKAGLDESFKEVAARGFGPSLEVRLFERAQSSEPSTH